MVGLGTLRTSFGAVVEPRPDFRAGYPQIGDKLGLGTSVVNGRGRLPR